MNDFFLYKGKEYARKSELNLRKFTNVGEVATGKPEMPLPNWMRPKQ